MNSGPDDAFADEETRRRPPWWPWLAGTVAGLAVFAGLALGFTHLLQTHVRHEPAAAVLADLPGAVPLQTTAPLPANPPPHVVEAAPEVAEVVAEPAEAAPAPPETPAAPAPPAIPSGPKIVLLLADAGANPALTRRAIEQLPPEVAFGFNPYPKGLPALAAAARAKGHEIWLGLPMEPQRYPQVDPGPQALLLNSTPERNLKRLEWVLARIEGEVGLYSIMGSAFTTREAALAPILAAVAEKELPFLDSRASGKTQSRQIARKLNLPLLVNDSFIGSPATEHAINEQLATLERLAKSRGLAVGVIEPSTLVLTQLENWFPHLKRKGITLTPPRALLDAKTAQD